MTKYERYVLPWLIHCAMRTTAARRERQRMVPLAGGVVLEVGIGPGLNLPLYRPAVTRLYGVDPSAGLLDRARRRVGEAAFPVELIEGSAEAIPLDDVAVDTVVSTWTLCSIPSPLRALREMRRVLRPDGQLIFIEHGHSPDPGVAAWQERLTPVWRRWAGGCELDRKIDELLTAGGFMLSRLDAGYGKGPRAFTYLYRGVARRREGGPPGASCDESTACPVARCQPWPGGTPDTSNDQERPR